MYRISICAFVLLATCFQAEAGVTSGIKKAVFGDKCIPVPRTVCALAYDDKDCNGWKLELEQGEKNFFWWDPIYYWYRNDIESISVRAGCTLTGFDDTRFQGRSITIRAGTRDRRVNLDDEDEFEDLDEKIQSVQCSCR